MADKTGYFNAHKYSSLSGKPDVDGDNATYVSPSDMMANMDMDTAMVVSFLHEPSGQDVYFKAFITTLNESYSSDWTEEAVFGRTDPIQLFRQTTRRITLGLKVPGETMGEAYDNLARVGRLTQFLYPSYSNAGQANTISQGPVLRMKVMNLIRNVAASSVAENAKKDPDGAPSPGALLNGYTSNPDSSRGLLGVITSLSINHNLETPDVGLLHKGKNTILSTNIELNIDFTVIHEKRLGWTSEWFDVEGFPYGAVSMADKDAAAQQAKLDAGRVGPAATEASKPTEQEILAAQKRYLSMGGKARMKKDLVWMQKMNQKQEELDKLSTSNSPRDKQRAERLARQLEQNAPNMEYIGSTLRGAGVNEGWFDGKSNGSLYASKKELRGTAAKTYDEFVE